MKMQTSRGNEYEVSWAGLSVADANQLLIRMPEARPLVELIAEMDGVEWAKTSDMPGQPDREYRGEFRLRSASRIAGGQVLIVLEMEAAA